MQQTRTPKEKELITEIAVRKLQIEKLSKELAKLESDSNQALWRKYEA